MINVAAVNQETESIIDQQTSATLSHCFGDFAKIPCNERACGLAFVAYLAWRREENGDGNLSDQQVFVISDGQVRPLPPRNDLRNHSPGFQLGLLGKRASPAFVSDVDAGSPRLVPRTADLSGLQRLLHSPHTTACELDCGRRRCVCARIADREPAEIVASVEIVAPIHTSES